MAEYSAVRGGKLKLKGSSGSLLGHKRKKSKKKKADTEEEWMKEPGVVRHGMKRILRRHNTIFQIFNECVYYRLVFGESV